MDGWELVCIDGGAVPQRMAVQGQVQIGRDPHCDVRLLAESASRFHARLEIDGTDVQLIDQRSRNGTLVDGQAVERARLADGASIRCGGAAFVLCRIGGATAVLSDQGVPMRSSTPASRPSRNARQSLPGLRQRLHGRTPVQRWHLLCEAAGRMSAARCALVVAGSVVAGDVPEALATRLAGGAHARLLLLGEHLHGQTVAAAAVGSAAVIPVPECGHLILTRGVDQEQLDEAIINDCARLADGLSPLLDCAPKQADDPLVGGSACMQELRRRIRRLATCDAPVLITGPSGSGKELVARALHDASGRSAGPFVAVNCGALNEQLVAAELFGAVAGAYTGAEHDRPGRFRAAEGGTLLLDEIGDLPRPLQATLLRVLQEGQVEPVGSDRPVPVNVRVLAATHVDLAAAVAAGRFRQDLYYRLDVLRIVTPGLEERPADIPELARHLCRRQAEAAGLPIPTISQAALDRLQRRAWPGQVRQLANSIHRALLLAEDARLDVADFAADEQPQANGSDDEADFPTLAAMEERHIRRALQRCAGNRSQAARLLGISRDTLHRRIRDLDL